MYNGCQKHIIFEDLSFEALASLPPWPQDEVPIGSVVTIGHTVQKFQTKKGEDSNVSLNIQYVLVLYCPEDVQSPSPSAPTTPSKSSKPSQSSLLKKRNIDSSSTAKSTLVKGKGRLIVREDVEESEDDNSFIDDRSQDEGSVSEEEDIEDEDESVEV